MRGMKRTPEVEGKEVVHVRLDVEVVRAVDHWAVDWGSRRPAAMERVLRLGLELLEKERELKEITGSPGYASRC